MGRYARAIPVAALAGLVSAGVGLALSGPADGSDAGSKRRHERAQRFVVRGLAPGLLTAQRGSVRVRITLRSDPVARGAEAPSVRVALGGRLGTRAESRLRRSPRAGIRLAWHGARRRASALQTLRAAATEAERSQVGLARALHASGGRLLATSLPTNSITALVPARMLRQLARRPDVAAINLAPVATAEGL